MSVPTELASVSESASQPDSACGINEGYGSLFGNRAFMALWIGQVFSQLADRIIFVVFITMIVTYFGLAGSLKSMLYVAFTIPAILLTAVAGVFVDRWPRRATLVSTNLLRAAIVAMIPLAIQANSIMALYACAFGISTITQFFVPAESATIPLITRRSQLLVANSLFTTTMMGSVIFGFALGDPLIHIVGLKQAHWAIFALFILSSVSLMLVKIPANAKPVSCDEESPVSLETVHAGSWQQFWNEMKEGTSYLFQNKILLHRILKLSVLFSAIVAMCFIFITFSSDILYANPLIGAQKFTWLISFSGLGMVLGAFIVGRYLREVPRSLLVYTGFTLAGLGLLLLIATPGFPRKSVFPVILPYLDYRVLYAHIVTIGLGIAAALIAVPLQSTLHEIIPADKRGKVMGVQFTLLSASSTFPALIAGVGVDYIGVMPMFALLGIPLLLLGVKGLYDRVKHGPGDDASTW